MPDGVLVLGSSETISRHERLFQPLDRANRIFVRRDGPSDIPSIYRIAAEWLAGRERCRAQPIRPIRRRIGRKAVAFASRRVLERFASPFVVVNAAGEIVHFSSHTGRFLEPAPGSPSANLFEMARHGWGLELRAALRRCIEMGRPVEQQRARSSVRMGERLSWSGWSSSHCQAHEADPLYMIAIVEAEQLSRRPSDPAPAAVDAGADPAGRTTRAGKP